MNSMWKGDNEMSYFRIVIKSEYVHLHGKTLICDCMKIDDGTVSLKNDGHWDKSLPQYCIEEIVPVDDFCY